MMLNEHLRATINELLADGRAITPGEVVARAQERVSAADLFAAEARDRFDAHLRRIVSGMLREADQPSDEDTASLFDVTDYAPPRCVTFRDENGELRRRAIEFADDADCDGYEIVLQDNIMAGTRRLFDFKSFRQQLRAGRAQHGVVGDALRRLRDEPEERAA